MVIMMLQNKTFNSNVIILFLWIESKDTMIKLNDSHGLHKWYIVEGHKNILQLLELKCEALQYLAGPAYLQIYSLRCRLYLLLGAMLISNL